MWYPSQITPILFVIIVRSEITTETGATMANITNFVLWFIKADKIEIKLNSNM